MKETFEDNLKSAKEQEAHDVQVFLELKAAKEEEITAGQQQVDTKSTELATTNESVATARQDVEDTQNSLAADDEYLLMVKEKCATTDKEWTERQKTRQEEITAVSEAISVLSSDDARDNFTKTFNPSSFVQVNMVQRKSVKKSQTQASNRLASAILADLSSAKKVKAASGAVKLEALEKVLTSLDGMVTELKEEEREESQKRDFCVESLHENEKEVGSWERKQNLSHEMVGELDSSISNLQTQIVELRKENEEMQTQLKRAGEDREKEHQEFSETIADQRTTRKLLSQAVATLKSFYDRKNAENAAIKASNAESASRDADIAAGRAQPAQFVQIRQVQEPASGDMSDPEAVQSLKGADAPGGFSDYKKSGGAIGVVSLLEEIIHSTEVLEQEVQHMEQESVEAYKTLQTETQRGIEKNNRQLTNNELNISHTKQDLEDAKAEVTDAVKALERAQNEGSDLHRDCDFLMRNFDVRVAARQEELDALAQAKAILSGADFA
jgi:DNA repair exonuclease SbcCD ATPase subunit